MSGEKFLRLRNIYGVNRKTNGNVFFLPLKNNTTFQDQGEQTVVSYVSGNTLVLRNRRNEKDVFIVPGSISKGITAVKVFKDKKYFGVGCKGESHPFILIYDTIEYKVRKTIQVPDIGSHEIICIDRSIDNRLLIAQGGAPEYRLSIWFFHDALKMKKVVGALEILDDDQDQESKVYKSSVNSTGKYICVTGEKLFRIFKVEEGKISLVRRELGLSSTENHSLYSHLWLESPEDRLIVTNGSGNIYLVEDNELKMMLNCSPSNELSLNCVIFHEKSFATGGEDGYITIFERSDDHDLFKKQKSIKLPNENNLFSAEELTITNMDFCNSSGNLVVSTRAGQIYLIQLQSFVQFKETEIENLVSFHFKKLTGLDAAIKKPYIAICSLDKTVRILNYHTGEIEIFKKFQMEAHSISIHPMGYFIVVGFTDKLRSFKILGKDLREEISYPIRNCYEVKFSNGGQFFAAAHGTSIYVYCSYTFQHLYSLRNAHTGKVSSLCWNFEDTHITSVDLNGNVVEFELKNETKIWDYLLADNSISCVCCNVKNTYVCGNDSKLHVFVEQSPLNEIKTDKYYFTSLAITDKGRLLFGGKVDGSIVVYSQVSLNEVRDTHFYQSESISRIITMHKGNLLVSISNDGSLCIFEICEKDKNYSTNLGQNKRIIEEWDEEILISKSDLTAKIDLIRELEVKCQDLKSDNEYNQIKKQLEFNNIIKQQSSSFEDEMKKKNHIITNLRVEMKDKEKKYEVKRKEKIENHKKVITELEFQYNERIHETLNKLKEVEENKVREINELAEKKTKIEETNLQNETNLKKKNQNFLKKLNEKTKKLKNEQYESLTQYDVELKKIKKVQNEYITKIEDEYERKLQKARLENEKLLKENEEKTSHEKRYDEKIEQLKNEIKEKQALLKKKKEEYEQKDRETKSIQKENKEREDTIAEKERRIHELNKQNKELKKFRFVLNYKIETLQNEINPNNQTIENMKKELKKYDNELEKYKNDRKNYRYKITDLERKIKGNDTELVLLKKKSTELQNYKKRMRADIHEVVQSIDDIKVLKRSIIQFYQKYASKTSDKHKFAEFDAQREYNRKVTYLEKTVEGLKNKLVKAKNTTNKETQRVMHENVMLLNEINQLRKELRFLKRRLFEKKSNYKRPQSDNLELHGPNLDLEQSLRILEMSKMELNTLRNQLNLLELEREQYFKK